MRYDLRLLAMLVVLWVGPTIAILRPAAGQEQTPEMRLVFHQTSLELEGTAPVDRIRRGWEAECRRLGGPGAKLEITWITAAYHNVNGGQPLAAMTGVCTAPKGAPA